MKSLNENIFVEFARLVKKVDGHVSYLSSLYLLGYLPEAPEELCIVSSQRKQDKIFDGCKVRMIFCSNIRAKRTQKVKIGKEEIEVASLEQALVDLVDYRPRGLTCKRIAQLFLTLPYEVSLLLTIARETGDTSLKRVMFYLCWTARAGWQDFSLRLSRIPVKLSPKQNDTDACWCNSLFVKFPQAVLKEFPSGKAPVNLPAETYERIELASFPPFRDYFARKQTFPIFNSPGFDENFDSFCREWLANEKNELIEALAETALNKIAILPKLIIEKVARLAENKELPDWLVLSAEKKLIDYIKRNRFEDAIIAVELTLRLNLYRAAFPFLLELRNILAAERRFDLIERLCAGMWKLGLLQEFKHSMFYLSSFVMLEKNDEATKVLTEIRHREEFLSESALADLSYYGAIIYNNRKMFAKALEELSVCRAHYEKTSDYMSLAGTQILYGSINMINGKFLEARRSFLLAFKLAKDINKPGAVEVETLTNLALLELIKGNFIRCIEIGNGALKKMCFTRGSIRECALLRIMIPAEVYSGNLAGAILLSLKMKKICKKLHLVSQKKAVNLFLAWLYELMGQSAVAATTWTHWDETKVATLFPSYIYQPFIQAKLTRLILNGKIRDARDCIEKSFEKDASCENVCQSLIAKLQLNLLHALLLAFEDKNKALERFRNVEAIAGNIDDCHGKKLVYIAMGSLFPLMVNANSLVKSLRFLLEQKSYDPFWFLYARELSERGIPEGIEFIRLQTRLTHEFLLKKLMKHYSFLRKPLYQKNTGVSEKTHLLIKPGKRILISPQDYGKRHSKEEIFFFDANTGFWSYKNQSGVIKYLSITHKLLSALFLAKNNKLSLSEIYLSIWGSKFDFEIDKSAAFSALTRARKTLKKISPLILLKWEKNGKHLVYLEMKINWEAVF